MSTILEKLPAVRGDYKENASLGEKSWFRCGGRADVLFKPADPEDLQHFLQHYNPSPDFANAQSPSPLGRGKVTDREQCERDIHIFGALSNVIIRDGGLKGVTIRLNRRFADITVEGDRITAGALALDKSVAKVAAENGLGGLEFFSGIPGTIGGAIKMNAGCYGAETKDVLVSCQALDRDGNLHTLTPRHSGAGQNLGEADPDFRRDDNGRVEEMTMTYRHTDLPEDYIIVSATFKGVRETPDMVQERMAQIRESREESQPIREKTGGSTFANPTAEQLSQAGLKEGTKVWQLIEGVGGRGLRVGGAQMSEKHCNFMINTGNATAADLENLGEEIRARVLDKYGIALRWEIRRIGDARL